MISIEECKKYLGNTELSDEKIEEIREVLYVMIEGVVDDYLFSDTSLNHDKKSGFFQKDKHNRTEYLRGVLMEDKSNKGRYILQNHI